jgi:hypothetical protein
MSSEMVTEEQALGLSDVAHGGDIGFIHSRTWRTLRSKGLVFQRGDGSMGLTDKGHDALSDAVRRWPVLLDRTPTPTPTPTPVPSKADPGAGERCPDCGHDERLHYALGHVGCHDLTCDCTRVPATPDAGATDWPQPGLLGRVKCSDGVWRTAFCILGRGGSPEWVFADGARRRVDASTAHSLVADAELATTADRVRREGAVEALIALADEMDATWNRGHDRSVHPFSDSPREAAARIAREAGR